jgi:hypothetical protein
MSWGRAQRSVPSKADRHHLRLVGHARLPQIRRQEELAHQLVERTLEGTAPHARKGWERNPCRLHVLPIPARPAALARRQQARPGGVAVAGDVERPAPGPVLPGSLVEGTAHAKIALGVLPLRQRDVGPLAPADPEDGRVDARAVLPALSSLGLAQPLRRTRRAGVFELDPRHLPQTRKERSQHKPGQVEVLPEREEEIQARRLRALEVQHLGVQGNVIFVQVGQDSVGQRLVEGQSHVAGGEDVGVRVGRALARLAIGKMGPVAALEGDLAEGFLPLEAVLPVEPGSIPACLTGEDVTLDCSRSRRSHLRISGGHPHGDYTAFERIGKCPCARGRTFPKAPQTIQERQKRGQKAPTHPRARRWSFREGDLRLHPLHQPQVDQRFGRDTADTRLADHLLPHIRVQRDPPPTARGPRSPPRGPGPSSRPGCARPRIRPLPRRSQIAPVGPPCR